MIEVLHNGVVVARVETAADAAVLIQTLNAPTPSVTRASETPAPQDTSVAGPTPKAPEPPAAQKPASPWTTPILVAFLKSLSDAGGKMIVALTKVGSGTSTEIGVAMGKDNGKGIGPARRLIEKQAKERGLPSPFADLDNGKIGLSREFSAAIAASRQPARAEASM